jgi:large subunit ribosomal protein L29
MPSRMREFRGMSDEQLVLTLKDTEKHLFQLRFQSATDRLETPSEIRKAKRDIARIKTIQREKELGKLQALTPEQLATRIIDLQKKEDEGQPGKRTAHRRSARLRRFYTEKGGKLPLTAPVAPAATGATPPAPVAGTKPADTRKPEAKKADTAKGSGK